MSRATGTVFVLSVVAVLAVVSASSVRADDVGVIFNDANTLYKEGDYEGAIERYVELVDGGVVDKNLYYNLANAYYKNNNLGKAVLFYERAIRLAPREKDARENLELVRTQLKDKQFVKQQNRVMAFFVVLHNKLSTTEMSVFASVCYIVLCLLATLYILRDSAGLQSFYRRVSIVSPGRLMGLNFSQDLLLAIAIVSILFATSAFSAYKKVDKELSRSEAVVVVEEIPVFSSPTEDATLQFRIHEGTLVTVRDERSGWYRIQLPGGLSGWVARGAVTRV